MESIKPKEFFTKLSVVDEKVEAENEQKIK